MMNLLLICQSFSFERSQMLAPGAQADVCKTEKNQMILDTFKRRGAAKVFVG